MIYVVIVIVHLNFPWAPLETKPGKVSSTLRIDESFRAVEPITWPNKIPGSLYGAIAFSSYVFSGSRCKKILSSGANVIFLKWFLPTIVIFVCTILGVDDYGSCYFASDREGESVLEGEPDLSRYDVNLYNVQISDNRCGCAQSFQGSDVRCVGELDVRGMQEARNDNSGVITNILLIPTVWSG